MKGTKRSLQSACPTFSKTAAGGVNNLENWTGTDNGGSLTLKQYCMANLCCGLSSTTLTADACSNWNDQSTYEICPNSCNGDASCRAIAKNANGSTVKIGNNACTGIQTCVAIARDKSSATVEVQMNACDGNYACSNIALIGNDSATVEIQMNACDGINACRTIARESSSATVEVQLNACIGNDACNSIRRESDAEANVLIKASECGSAGQCQNCGKNSDFTGIFDANQSCCDVVNTDESTAGFLDTACHESMMPSGKKKTETSNHN